ncbi:calcium-binding protein [Rhizobium cremeum]|uniref:calcium-binding protein n=1 Tax=Rhizobium cremeum TaxID=2813827 RepID=UPI000DE44EC8
MYARKTTLAALATALLVSASSGIALAQSGKGSGPMDGPCGPRPMMMRGPAGMFIHGLQEFDANKDGKISKDEAKAGSDTLFAAIDADKDGNLTPGELRKYREARTEAWKASMPKPPAAEDADKAQAPAPQDDASTAPPPPPDDMADDDDMGMPNGPRDCGPRDGKGPHDGKGWRDDKPRFGRHDDRDGPDRNRPRDEMGMGPMGHHGMRRIMARMDTDENGQISKAEAAAATDKLFDRFDTNKDGFISADDFPAGPKILP